MDLRVKNMVITKVDSNRGKPLIIVDNQKYRQAFVKKNGIIRWRCPVKHCTATIYTDAMSNAVLSGIFEHLHETNPNLLQRQKLRTACKRQAEEFMSVRPEKIIEHELFKMDEHNYMLKQDIQCVRQSMYRVRQKRVLFQAEPKTRKEFQIILEDVGLITTQDEGFVLVNDKESEIVILGSESNLKFLCEEAEGIFADDSFKCYPSFYEQMYTIHGFKNGQYVPLLFCLLPLKSKDCYRILSYLLDRCCQSFNLSLNFNIIHLDFDIRIHTAMKEHFPFIVIKSTRFHLGQAWWQKLQDLGLAKKYRNKKTEKSKWLHDFFGLAFLDSDEVEDCFTEDLVPEMPKDEDVEKFADYILSTFITRNALFPPYMWAKTPPYSRRTDVGPVAFYSKYNKYNCAAPTMVLNFSKQILRIQENTYDSMKSMRWHIVKYEGTDSEKDIVARELFKRYTIGEITRRSYVRLMGEQFQPLM